MFLCEPEAHVDSRLSGTLPKSKKDCGQAAMTKIDRNDIFNDLSIMYSQGRFSGVRHAIFFRCTHVWTDPMKTFPSAKQ